MRRMSRVLVTSTPGAGHVLPLLRLARALRERGDDVRWATAAGAIPALEREGFVATPAGPEEAERRDEYRRRFPDLPFAGPGMRAHAFPNMFGGIAAPLTLPPVLAYAERWRPDVVVHDMAEMAGP